MPDNATVNPTLASPAVATKPGWKTTEFWVTLLVAVASIISAASGVLPKEWAVIAGAVASGCYAISRSITKANDPTPPSPSDPTAPLRPPGG